VVLRIENWGANDDLEYREFRVWVIFEDLWSRFWNILRVRNLGQIKLLNILEWIRDFGRGLLRCFVYGD
jgi:hypothetical protein